jgi:hypothetical protein
MTRSDWWLALMRCGPAIRKDDPAKHLDKLIAAGDGRKSWGIVVLRWYEGDSKHHILIRQWQFLRRRSPCV